MNNIDIILNTLGEKIKNLEAMLFIKDLEIKELKDKLASQEVAKDE